MNKKKLLWKKWEKLNFTWELFVFHWKKCVVCNWKSRAHRTFTTYTYTHLCFYFTNKILQTILSLNWIAFINMPIHFYLYFYMLRFWCRINLFFLSYLSFEVNVCIFVIIICKWLLLDDVSNGVQCVGWLFKYIIKSIDSKLSTNHCNCIFIYFLICSNKWVNFLVMWKCPNDQQTALHCISSYFNLKKSFLI